MSCLGIAVLLMAIAGCESDPGPPPTPKSVVVTPAALTLFAGDTARLAASVLDANGSVISGTTVQWSTTNPDRVKVDSAGLLTVVTAPFTSTSPSLTSTITATYTSLAGHATVDVPYRPGLSVFPASNVLYVGMTRQLISRLVSVGDRTDEVTVVTGASWKTSNPSVITVSDGTITAVGVGQAQVTATVSDGRTSTASVTVLAKLAQPLRFVAASGGMGLARKTIDEFYDSRACGLTTDGSVYCWGLSSPWMTATDLCETRGRTSQSTSRLITWKCSEIPQLMPSPVKFTSIVVRGDNGCGVALNARVYCWGTSIGPYIGIGSTSADTIGVTAIGSTDSFVSVQMVTGFTVQACALRVDGAEVCWGGNFGNKPTVVAGVTFQQVSDGADCGLGVDKAVYCFNTGAAVKTGGDGPWSAAIFNACALDAGGVPYCGLRTTPTKVADVPALAGVGTYSPNRTPGAVGCGFTAGGDLYCFGVGPIAAGFPVSAASGTCLLGSDGITYCNRYQIALGGFALGKVPGQD